jgi:hypothetical protein
VAAQHRRNSKVIINQATCLVIITLTAGCNVFFALGDFVPLESLQQHTCAEQDKDFTFLSTSAVSTLSIVLVVPLRSSWPSNS